MSCTGRASVRSERNRRSIAARLQSALPLTVTPAQVKAWDRASPRQRVLWLMTSRQRRTWDGATPAQQDEWMALWCETRAEEWCAPESWWRIGLPDEARSDDARESGGSTVRDAARRIGQMDRIFAAPVRTVL